MSITLSVPPAIVQEVREWAEAHGTSLNQYIRDLLEAKANEERAARKRRVDEFFEFIEKNTVHVPEGWKFSREEATERKMKCLEVL